MAYMMSDRREPSKDVVLQLLTRLWQTKLRSITTFEKWLSKTSDAEIRAGLQLQLVDERRHLRILSEEIKRLGGSIAAQARDNVLTRPFALVQAQPTDLYRLSTFHHGIKAFTLDRCGHLLPMVDEKLARILEQIARDEERHIRWADIRVSRILQSDEVRQVKQLIEKMELMLEPLWPRPWLDAARGRFSHFLRR
jgi:hypothetical protein